MSTYMAMLKAPAKEQAQSQKGTALIEFAFVLPVFLLLLFGMITFSIALYNKTVLTMATLEGARKGAISSDTGQAKAAAEAACTNLISFGTSSTPDIPEPTIVTNTKGDKIINVSANLDYTGVYIFSYIIPISAQTSMRLESP